MNYPSRNKAKEYLYESPMECGRLVNDSIHMLILWALKSMFNNASQLTIIQYSWIIMTTHHHHHNYAKLKYKCGINYSIPQQSLNIHIWFTIKKYFEVQVIGFIIYHYIIDQQKKSTTDLLNI